MQEKKGISLIVLVITIIVMIILAGAIILSLNNSGIIGKANQAVKFTDEATVKEIAQMAWAEAYADGVRSVEDTKINGKDVEGFKKRVEKALEDNDINKDGNIQYFLNVTEKGVTVKPVEEAWILNREELKVKRGEEELTVGQDINYKSGVSGYTDEKGWKVLGADADGNLLVMSSKDIVTNYRLGYESKNKTIEEKLKECHKDWLYGTEELDNKCLVYGKGTGALGARSINEDDINKITGHNKTAANNNQLYKYGNIVTYKYNKTITPEYSGANGKKGILSDHDSGFYFSNGRELKHISLEELTAEKNNGKIITTLTNTSYATYDAESYLNNTTEAYKMIFGTSDASNYYWLASSYVTTLTNHARFGMYYIGSCKLLNYYLFTSEGEAIYSQRGIRAVVTISSDVAYQDLVNI